MDQPRRGIGGWLYWSPGNSPRAQEIITHLTPGERRRYRVASLLVLLFIGVALSCLSPLLLVLILKYRFHAPALLGALASYIVVLCIILQLMQWRTRHFLRHTAWSKGQGWDREPL